VRIHGQREAAAGTGEKSIIRDLRAILRDLLVMGKLPRTVVFETFGAFGGKVRSGIVISIGYRFPGRPGISDGPFGD